MKLFFSSFIPSAEQDAALAKVIGKAIQDTKVAYIENACDVYNDEASLTEGREILKIKAAILSWLTCATGKMIALACGKNLSANRIPPPSSIGQQ